MKRVIWRDGGQVEVLRDLGGRQVRHGAQGRPANARPTLKLHRQRHTRGQPGQQHALLPNAALGNVTTRASFDGDAYCTAIPLRNSWRQTGPLHHHHQSQPGLLLLLRFLLLLPSSPARASLAALAPSQFLVLLVSVASDLPTSAKSTSALAVPL